MELRDYVERCSELFAVGGHEAVRRTAQAGLDELGPSVPLYRWLGQAHAAEDEDDHDAEAERVFRQGLALDPDDLGLLVCYLELCLRADAFDHPGRAKRAITLRARVEELAPPGSPMRERVDDALSWAGRGYWDDFAHGAASGRAHAAEAADLGERVAEAFRARAAGTALAATGQTEDLREAETAAAVELLRGWVNAPLRLLVTHRAGAYVLTACGALTVNRVLAMTGATGFRFWGWALYAPLLLADARVRAARRLARERVVARIEERHASTVPAGDDADPREAGADHGGTGREHAEAGVVADAGSASAAAP
ncbi:hypothetical protein [Streptomyces sp. NPDC003717]|uniref:hypothetical protein n=1 Tax=Streptomyces sp. NPDC003717 TaxID=3154276 RepID=UPI0033A7EF89